MVVSRKTKIGFCLAFIFVAVAAIALFGSSAPLPNKPRVTINLVSYTNDAAGQPIALLEVKNDGTADVLPYSCEADLQRPRDRFLKELDDGSLGAGASRIIAMQYKTNAVDHIFGVSYSASPLRFRLYHLAALLRVQKLVPRKWGNAFSEQIVVASQM